MTMAAPTATIEKIRNLLLRSGLAELPAGADEDLAAYGLDSLAVVLFVVTAEKEFGVKIDPLRATLEDFANLNAILQVLRTSTSTQGQPA